ncbi:MAG: 30S ribosomal protein S17 [Bacilli bacterium]
MMERNSRKVYIGKVSSDKGDKTIQVLISTHRKHPLYGKRVEYTKNITVHDEENLAKIGDVVKVMETRPLSKTKRFRLVEIIEKAVIV